MRPSPTRKWSCGAVCLGLLLLSACAENTPNESELFLSPSFGRAVRQDIAAQIADPDAQYSGTPAPGSNGSRVALAQRRYVAGKVLRPPSTAAAEATIGGEGGGGGGDNGGGDSGPPAGQPMPSPQ